MRKFLLYMLLLSVSLPAHAADNEFKFGVTTNTRYNDNVNNVESDKKGAFIFELGPRFQFDTRHSKYEAGLTYSPRFTTFTDDDRIDQFNQHLGANGEYRFSDKLTFSVRDALSIETEADRDVSNDVTLDLDGDSQKQTYRNNLGSTLRYNFSERGSVAVNGGYNLIDRRDRDLSDVDSLSGRLQVNYVATVRNTFGIGTTVRNQQVEGSASRRKTETDYYGFFLFASHRFSPVLGVEASGGPTWLRSTRNDPDETVRSNEIEYFASAALTADFERGVAALEYGRASSDVAFSATTFLIDQVTASFDWQFTPRLFGGVSGEWNTREAILKFQGNEFDNTVTQWIAAVNLSMILTPEVFMGFTVDYLRQEADTVDDVDRFRAVVRFDYNPRAIRF